MAGSFISVLDAEPVDKGRQTEIEYELFGDHSEVIESVISGILESEPGAVISSSSDDDVARVRSLVWEVIGSEVEAMYDPEEAEVAYDLLPGAVSMVLRAMYEDGKLDVLQNQDGDWLRFRAVTPGTG